MLALTFLAVLGALQEPNIPQTWSLLAAKWIVPLVLFQIAGSLFRDQESLRKLEMFSLAMLFYLTFIAILSVLGINSLVFPRFILDKNIGIHADRARGPLLQAVANGVCLNILGLIAFDCFRRRSLRGMWALILFLAVPLALLATKTRAVWLSAAFSLFCLAMFSRDRRLSRPALALCGIGMALTCGVWLHTTKANVFADRVVDQSPVDFRLDMYQAGWQMFVAKPAAGWGSEAVIQPEIERRISSFHPERYLFHNTYLELAVERGLIGIALYTWLMACLFRLAKRPVSLTGAYFLDGGFRRLWPVIVVVYLINASAVVMNYQFVNGFVFTIAGILSAQTSEQEAKTCNA
jgi:O-antigen ligase